ncbi:hypothetical protein L7F22_030040 [Adiantum nelumboides]|nr:hypothetical protein [Adiantum nelumboides]
MIILSFNVKGLSDLTKAKKVKDWLRQQKHFDAIILTEIKCSGEELSNRLKSIDSQLKWVVSDHRQGAGGVACGMKSNWANQIKGTHKDPQNQWLAIELDAFVLIRVYANCPQAFRGSIWDSLRRNFYEPIVVIGDFNMVELSKDRFLNQGKVIAGSEKTSWNACKNHFNLVDIGVTGQFTWQNYGTGNLLRKARLDRCYISQGLCDMYVNVDCQARFDTCISDHYPICASLVKKDHKIGSKWFHTDPNLFKLPIVQEEVAKIWKYFFNIGITPAKAWSLAVKSTQSLLICKRIGMQKTREWRKNQYTLQIEELEKNVNKGNSSAQNALREARAKLNRFKDRELEDKVIFFREWWAGKADRPTPEMFRMLTAKHAADFIPFMKDKTGNEVSSDKENQRLIANHFWDLLTDNLVLKEDQDRASNKVKMCRPKTIPPIQSLWLEQELSAEEISRAIDILPIRKSPGKDGLPSEFFKTFKECLIGPLVAVWREAISFEALPLPINEGIIKLIHKKEEKNIITNWRPITLLNCAYKIFAKALALRLKDHMSKWIREEQKGFIKGRFILDNIVTLWEAMEYAEEVGQDYVFLKINFDKAYDRLNWNYTIDALRHMGCGEKFCSMVKTLLGNASAKVNVNGTLSESFQLSRSIRQGCPLAPLLYAVAADGLNWLVHDRINSGKMQGIVIDNGDQICIEMFVDDTNAIMQNDVDCIANFWECLHIYCTASGLVINHTKIGFRTSIQNPPIWLTEEGCKPI